MKILTNSNGQKFKMGRKLPSTPHGRPSFKDMLKAGVLPEVKVPATTNYSGKAAASLHNIYENDKLGDCLVPGTRISMSDGTTKPIEEIQIFDQVCTAEGNKGIVAATMKRYVDEPLIKIVAFGHQHLKMTNNHPVLTRNGYVKAGDLKAGDWITLPIRKAGNKEFFNTKDHLCNETLFGAPDNGSRWHGACVAAQKKALDKALENLPDRIYLNAEFGRIIGLFLAEGSTNQNNVAWTFCKDERETLVKDLVNLLKSQFNIDAKLCERNSVIDVRVSSKVWRMIFRSLCGKGAHKKRLHADIADGSKEFLKAVFDAWMEGDGHARRQERVGVTVSRVLAMDMFNIAQTLELRPNISHRKAGKSTAPNGPNGELREINASPSWSISVPNNPGAVANRSPKSKYRGVGWNKIENKWNAWSHTSEGKSKNLGMFNLEEDAAKIVIKYRNENGFFGDGRSDAKDGVVWKKIRKIDLIPYSGFVFNFEVQGDNSYVAEGVGTHNCVIAGGFHIRGLTSGNSGNCVTFTNEQVIQDYSLIGGYNPNAPLVNGQNPTDEGCDEGNALKVWMQTGFPDGVKLNNSVSVDATNLSEVRLAMYLFENLMFGVCLPDSWVNPFPSGPNFRWDKKGPPDPENGHCFISCDLAGSNGLKIDSWGMTGFITNEAISYYAAPAQGGELFALLLPDVVSRLTEKTTAGFNISQLTQYLATL